MGDKVGGWVGFGSCFLFLFRGMDGGWVGDGWWVGGLFAL